MASQEAELTFKKQNIEALITKIGLQTERVSSKREAADAEAQKVRYPVIPHHITPFTPCTFCDFIHCAGFVQVAVIQAEVSAKQKDCENDLAKAEPSLTAATAALHTLNKVLHFINADVILLNLQSFLSFFLNFCDCFLGESYRAEGLSKPSKCSTQCSSSCDGSARSPRPSA